MRWFLMTCLLFLAAPPAMAQTEGQIEVPRGLWETEPDANGVILHVRTRRCGRALCGRVERAKNRGGYDTPSDAVGEKVLWELQPRPDGSFLGEYRGSNGRRYLETRVEIMGRKMRLEACTESDCRAVIWNRIR